MSAWSLLAVPLCLGGMVILLMGISWFEERLLSPRSLILYTAKSRHVGPDTVERLIAAQSEELLRSRGIVLELAKATRTTRTATAEAEAPSRPAATAASAATAARAAATAATGATAAAANGAAKVAKAAASAAASATAQSTPAAIRP